jgi:hypothetical protein
MYFLKKFSIVTYILKIFKNLLASGTTNILKCPKCGALLESNFLVIILKKIVLPEKKL